MALLAPCLACRKHESPTSPPVAATDASGPAADVAGDFSIVEPGPVRTNSIGMKLVLVPPGQFRMGTDEAVASLQDALRIAPADRDKPWTQFHGQRPSQQVRITQPFEIGVYEVTKGQFAQFVAATNYQTDAERENTGWGYSAQKNNFVEQPGFCWRECGFEQTDQHPVVNVSHHDGLAFCQWLSDKEGRQYSLPTEAQWEYACRAGAHTRWWFGDDVEELAAAGNVADTALKEKFPWWEFTVAASDGFVFSAPVGSFRPNPLGLYDTCGNAAEWCADWSGREYDSAQTAVDPTGPAQGQSRMVRGGGWHNYVFATRSAARNFDGPTYRVYDIGFRVVCAP